MSAAESECERATEVAVKLTEEFDFDCREILSCHALKSLDGERVFRIVIRLWASPERIESTIASVGEGQNVDLMREILGDGNRLEIDATSNRVVKHKWLGIQFS